jgi:hypothetical protein
MRAKKTRDEFNETIVLDALRRFMLNSDLSDQRISRLMGVEIETLRTWVAGTANPQKKSLNKIRSFPQMAWAKRPDGLKQERSEMLRYSANEYS